MIAVAARGSPRPPFGVIPRREPETLVCVDATLALCGASVVIEASGPVHSAPVPPKAGCSPHDQCLQRLQLLATAAALAPTVDRRTALALPLAVVPVAARAATDDVIVSGTVSAADAVVEPDAALCVTMRRGGAPQAAFSQVQGGARAVARGRSHTDEREKLPDRLLDPALCVVSRRAGAAGRDQGRGADRFCPPRPGRRRRDAKGRTTSSGASTPGRPRRPRRSLEQRGVVVSKFMNLHPPWPRRLAAREPSGSHRSPAAPTRAEHRLRMFRPPHVRASKRWYVDTSIGTPSPGHGRSGNPWLARPTPAHGLLEGAARARVLHVVRPASRRAASRRRRSKCPETSLRRSGHHPR